MAKGYNGAKLEIPWLPKIKFYKSRFDQYWLITPRNLVVAKRLLMHAAFGFGARKSRLCVFLYAPGGRQIQIGYKIHAR